MNCQGERFSIHGATDGEEDTESVGQRHSITTVEKNPDIANPCITKTPVERTTFFSPVIVKSMEKNPDITNLRYKEHILQVLSYFVIQGVLFNTVM